MASLAAAVPGPSAASTSSDVYTRNQIPDPMGVLRPHDYTKIKVLSLNLCFFYLCIAKPEVDKEFGLQTRLPKIIRMIQSEKPDFVLLQEGRETTMHGGFRDLVMKVCEAINFYPIIQHNNADPGGFIQVTLYNAQKFFHSASDRFYPREGYDDIDCWGDEFGNGFGRETTINTFYRLMSQKHRSGNWQNVVDYNSQPITLFNQHLGLVHKEILHHLEVTIRVANTRFAGHHVLSIGDHNPQPPSDDGSIDTMLEPYKRHGWTRLMEPPYFSQHGVEVRGSFSGYSIDRFVQEQLKGTPKTVVLEQGHFGRQLDHGFYRGPQDLEPDGRTFKEELSFKAYNVVGCFDGTDHPEPKIEEDYFGPDDSKRDQLYSDHAALVVEMTTVRPSHIGYTLTKSHRLHL